MISDSLEKENHTHTPLILMGKRQNLCGLLILKDVHNVKALHSFDGICKYTHYYHLFVDFLHQTTCLVQIVHLVCCLGCQSWIRPKLHLPLFGLFLQVLGYCFQLPLLFLPLA